MVFPWTSWFPTRSVALEGAAGLACRVAIPEGAVLEAGMLTTKRPGNGIPAVRLAELLGRRTARPIEANVLLEEADVV